MNGEGSECARGTTTAKVESASDLATARSINTAGEIPDKSQQGHELAVGDEGSCNSVADQGTIVPAICSDKENAAESTSPTRGAQSRTATLTPQKDPLPNPISAVFQPRAESDVAHPPRPSSTEPPAGLEIELEQLEHAPSVSATEHDTPPPSVPGPSLKAAEQTPGSQDFSDTHLKLLLDFTTDIIDKQYRSYVWNDGKVQALVTIDAALIAGLLLILQIFGHVSAWALALMGCAFALLVVSFVVCLIHAIPKIHSGVGQRGNLRTMFGIGEFNKIQYHKKITSLEMREILRMNCWQITGMCRNNLRSHRLIMLGATLTIAGVLALATALPIVVIPEWARRGQTSSQPQPSSQLPSQTGTESSAAGKSTKAGDPQQPNRPPIDPGVDTQKPTSVKETQRRRQK